MASNPVEEIQLKYFNGPVHQIPRSKFNIYIKEKNFIRLILNQELSKGDKSLKMFNEYSIYQYFDSELMNTNPEIQDIGKDNRQFQDFLFFDYTKPSNDSTAVRLTQEEIDQELKELKKFEVDTDDYIFLRNKSNSLFSKVSSVLNKTNNQLYAIKALHSANPTRCELYHFKNFISMLSSLKNPAILPFIGFSSKSLSTITQFMPGYCLNYRLHDAYRPLESTNQTIIALGIAYAIRYLHNQGYIHRDLNSLSILLNEDDHPYIADFSFMSPKNNENCFKQITPWTAPEMMTSTNYNEKVDVYSYGFLLWEILTKETPFRGLTPLQIQHEVCDENRRPLLPQNSPPKLKQLIKSCWDKDPEKRPDFDFIIDAFETGKISFLGASYGPVEAYAQLFKEKTTSSSERSTTEESTVVDLIKQVKSNPLILPTLLSKQLTDEEIHSMLSKNYFMISLRRCADISELSDFVGILFTFLYSIKDKTELFSKLENKQLISILLRLFKKYGTTHVPYFMDVIDSLYDDSSTYIFSYNSFKHFSPFLLSPNVSIRMKITLFLNKVVKTSGYDSNSSLVPLIPILLPNLSTNILKDLLISTLELVESLTSFPETIDFVIAFDGANFVIPLCLTDDENITSRAFHLINNILSKSKPTESFVQNYLSQFANFTFRSSSSEALQPLVILTHLVKTPEFIAFFVDNKEAISAFSLYLESEDETVLGFALHLTFSLISSTKMPANFSTLGKQLVTCLSSPNPSISIMAAACLISIAPTITNNYESIFHDDLVSYLKQSLKIENKSSEKQEKQANQSQILRTALRLAGSLSLTIEGAQILEDNSIVPLIFNHIDDEDNREIILTILTSQSAQIPVSQFLIDLIPKLISILTSTVNKKNDQETVVVSFKHNMIPVLNLNLQQTPEPNKNNGKVTMLTLTLLGNILSNPRAPLVALKFFNEIIQFASDNDLKVQHQALKIVLKMMGTYEARNELANKELISTIIASLLPLTDSEETSYDAYKALVFASQFQEGQEILTKILPDLQDKLANIDESSNTRIICLKLVSRLSH